MNKSFFLAAVATAAIAAATPADAATVYNDFGAWAAAASTYNQTTNYGSNYDNISTAVLNGGATMSFSNPVNVRQVGSGWATWSGGYMGQVLYTNGATSLDVALSPVSAFGFYVEPNPFSVHTITLKLLDGSSVSGTYNGSAGAGFLGFVGTGVSSLNVSSDVDFAAGNFFAAGVPEPTTWAMMVLGFGMVGAGMRARSRKPVVTCA